MHRIESIDTLNSGIGKSLVEKIAMLSAEGMSIWSYEEQVKALEWLTEQFGQDWQLDTLYDRFGRDEISNRITEIIKSKSSIIDQIDEIIALDRKKTKCHICKIENPVCYYDFGMAKQLKIERDWTKTLVSLGLSAITFPLIGFGGFIGPEKKTSYKVIRLHLMVCSSCKESRLNRNGKRINLTRSDYSRHPAAAKAIELGYSIFFSKTDLEQMTLSF